MEGDQLGSQPGTLRRRSLRLNPRDGKKRSTEKAQAGGR